MQELSFRFDKAWEKPAFNSKPVQCVFAAVVDFNQRRGHSRLPAFHSGFEQWWASTLLHRVLHLNAMNAPPGPWLAIQIIVRFEYICSPLQIQSLAAGCSVVGCIYISLSQKPPHASTPPPPLSASLMYCCVMQPTAQPPATTPPLYSPFPLMCYVSCKP